MSEDFRERINNPAVQRQKIAIELRVWQRTCDALATAELENVELRRRLNLWSELNAKNGWVDAEAVEEAIADTTSP